MSGSLPSPTIWRNGGPSSPCSSSRPRRPASGGHVNLSPKGLDSLRILGPNRVAYLDLTGSGVETIAHLRDNGRITLMACAFSGAPRISRFYGSGVVHEAGSPAFEELAPAFPDLPGAARDHRRGR